MKRVSHAKSEIRIEARGQKKTLHNLEKYGGLPYQFEQEKMKYRSLLKVDPGAGGSLKGIKRLCSMFRSLHALQKLPSFENELFEKDRWPALYHASICFLSLQIAGSAQSLNTQLQRFCASGSGEEQALWGVSPAKSST